MSKSWAYFMGVGVAYTVAAVQSYMGINPNWRSFVLAAVVSVFIGFGYEFLRRKI